MSNVKKGELAVILRGNHPESTQLNNGRFVEVIAPHNDEPVDGMVYLDDGPAQLFWIVEAKGDPLDVIEISGWRECVVKKARHVVSDARLKPIRDNPGNESWFKAAPLSLPSQPRQTVPQSNTNNAPASV